MLIFTSRLPSYLKTLLAPTLVTAKTFAEIAKVVQDHVQPKPSVIMRRFRFNTCSRNQGESITAFVARLRELASHCEYGDTAAQLIRDRLVCGIRDDRLQRSLLCTTNLTFDKAVQLALLHEAAEQNAKVLSAPLAVHRTEPAQAPDGPKRTSYGAPARRETACYRCGGKHQAKSCRFKLWRAIGRAQPLCRRRERTQLARP